MKDDLICVINLDGIFFNVVGDLKGIKNRLISRKSDWEENTYTQAFTFREGNVVKEDYEFNFLSALDVINSIETVDGYLTDYVRAIRKKGNKKFWAKSGTTVYSLEFASEFFTDFTNAWSIPQLRLEVVDEITCELVFRNRTETY